MSHTQTVSPKMTALENAVLAVLAPGAPMTLAEIECELWAKEISFIQGDLALAVLDLQERNVVANTLAYQLRLDPKGH